MVNRDSHFYKHLITFRTVFYIIVLSFFITNALGVTSTYAQTPSYTVDNVRVDVTSDNAVQAREQAFEAAQIKAYEMLVKRFLSDEERKMFETPSLSKISSLVQNFEVTNEKLSATRYSGTYEISFMPHKIGTRKQSIDNGDIAKMPSGAMQSKILVIPVIKKDGRNYIWADGPYRNAWKNTARQSNIIIPIGDASDRMAIRDDEALSYDYNRLNTLIRRYNADQTFMAVTNPQSSKNGMPSVAVALYAVKPSGLSLVNEMTMPIYSGEMPDELFSRVATQSKIALESRIAPPTKVSNSKPSSQSSQSSAGQSVLTAQLDFSSMRDWVALKRYIENTQGISSLTIKSMTAQNAVVDIGYRGDINSLALNFRQQQLILQSPIRGNGQYGSSSMYQIKKIR